MLEGLRKFMQFHLAFLLIAAGCCGEVTPKEFRPTLQVHYPFGALPVQTSEIFLNGHVSDASSLKDFQINGESIPVENGCWMAVKPVTVGINQFVCESEYKDGTVQELVLDVTAEPIIKLPDALKDRLIVLPTIVGGTPTYRTQLFSDSLSENLFIADRFRVVERTQLEQVLLEHQLRRSDLSNVENAVRVGKLLLAEHVLLLRLWETEGDFSAAARLVSVSDQRIVWTATYKTGSALASDCERLGKGLGLSLAMLFCTQNSVVLDVSDMPEIYLDKGFVHGVSENNKVLLNRHNSLVGIGAISEAQDEVAKAVIEAPDISIEPGDVLQVLGYMNLPK